MKTKNIKFNFKRLYLNKNGNINKDTTLKEVLDKFLEENLNKKEIISADEKEIILKKVDVLSTGALLTYELINFGKRSKIKDRNTLKQAGEIADNQYLEKYQYIYLNRKDNDNYNIIFQLTREGIGYGKFYTLIHKFYETFKQNKDEELADTLLLSSSYYSKDFFTKLSKVNMISSLTIEGGFDNPDMKFAGVDKENEPTFTCTMENKIKVKPNKKRFAIFKDIKDFLKDVENKYGTIKIKLHGKDSNNNTLKIYSDNLELNHEINISIAIDKEIEYNQIKTSLLKDTQRILEEGWVEIASD